MAKFIDEFREQIDAWLENFPEWERAMFKVEDRVGEGIYEIPERIIEAGGENATLEVATQISPRRKVVAKYHSYHPIQILQDDKKLFRRFKEEAERWDRFAKSPHVVHIYQTLWYISSDRCGGWWVSFGFLMEYSELGDLAINIPRLIKHGYRRAEMLNLMLQVTEAIQIGHLRGVIHGDIKPQNILMFESAGMPIPKVMDFGYSVTQGTIPSYPGAGTPAYAAPELFYEDGQISTSSDIYALGIVTYEVLIGCLPFKIAQTALENDPRELYEMMHKYQDPDLTPLVNAFGREMGSLVEQMLAKDSDKRPSAKDVMETLQECRNDINSKYKDPSHDAAILPGYYCWNPGVHKILGDELQFYIMQLPNVQVGTRELMSRLRAEGLYCFSIYRIMGGSDRLLRIWVRPSNLDKVEEVIKESGSQVRRMRVHNMQSFHGEAELTKANAEDIIKEVYSAACKENRAEEEERLKRAGLVLGVHGGASVFPLRLFMSISFNERKDPFWLEAFAKHLKNDMSESGHVHDISWYHSNGEPSYGDFQILLKFRLTKFEDFACAIDAFDQLVIAYLGGHSTVRSQTYLEIDRKPIVENDDGSVVQDVNLYRDKKMKEPFVPPKDGE